MPETDRWLSDYGDSHRNVTHPFIYWPSVPLLAAGMVGMLWSLPVPAAFVEISPLLNWGSAFLMAAAIYYFILSVSLAIGMLPFVVALAALQLWVGGTELSLSGVSLALVATATAGLYLGHRAQGGVPAVLRDIQLMMIGPAWLLAGLYRRLGIPY